MKYDRDIRRVRIAFWILLAIDLFMLGGALYKHSWVNAIAAAIWALNCRVSLGLLKVHQANRDHDRGITEAIFKELQDLER